MRKTYSFSNWWWFIRSKSFLHSKKNFLFILYKGWRIYQLSTFSNYGHFQKLQPGDLNIYTETALKTYKFEALINQKYWAKGEKRTCEMIETLKTLKEERGSWGVIAKSFVETLQNFEGWCSTLSKQCFDTQPMVNYFKIFQNHSKFILAC